MFAATLSTEVRKEGRRDRATFATPTDRLSASGNGQYFFGGTGWLSSELCERERRRRRRSG